MTGGPSAGPSSAYPMSSTPASTCLYDRNPVWPVGGAAAAFGIEVATEAPAAARLIIWANSRLLIMLSFPTFQASGDEKRTGCAGHRPGAFSGAVTQWNARMGGG